MSDLKPLLLSRKEASQQLSVESSDGESSTTPSFSSARPKKCSRLDRLEKSNLELRSLLEGFMRRFEPAEGSASELSDNDFEELDELVQERILEPTADRAESWIPPALSPCFSQKGAQNVQFELDFSPHTQEQEPSIGPPRPHIAEQGVQCQRLGQSSFARIRYADVQKKLQATPIFGALSVNQQLAQTNPGPLQEHLSRMDMTLGTISHGLLLQRDAFAIAMRKLGEKHPDLRPDIQELFLDPEAAFKSLSDDILQYTCGRRAEAIEQRRKCFKPHNAYVASLLDGIPPSASHLFSEEPLADLLKQHGGFFRAFPRVRDQTPANQQLRLTKYTQKPPSYPQAGTSRFRATSKATTSGVQIDDPREPLNVGRQGLGIAADPAKERPTANPEANDSPAFRGGQLANFTAVWQKLGAPRGILSIIGGYSIPFILKPPLAPLSEAKSRRFSTPGMKEQIQMMSDQGILETSSSATGFLSKLFPTQKADGRTRPIFNLRELNRYLQPKKFRLISHFKVPSFLQKGDFMVKLDLTQAYFHVPVKLQHRRFLSLISDGRVLQMTCLPFGLSSAPLAFARLSNWIASQLRSKGMRVIVYLDDFLLADQDSTRLRHHLSETIHFLESLGWSINHDKSVEIPTTAIEYLGIRWDTLNDVMYLPTGKKASAKTNLEKVAKRGA